jgi:anti-sigma regulatory factor (Ser/Thr protein kinase)
MVVRTVTSGEPTGQAGTPWPLSSALVLGALPSAVGCARLHSRNLMHEWGLPATAEAVELVVSELVTNAVLATTGADGRPRYADDLAGLPEVHVRLSSDRARVIVEVWDTSTEAPARKRQAELDEPGGRGLMLVEALSERWGWGAVPGWAGKVVWAELRAADAA